MKIVVLADEAKFNQLKGFNLAADWVRVDSSSGFMNHADADAYFNLLENTGPGTELLPPDIPFFLSSVLLPKVCNNNIIRINGWNGFLEKDLWEVAGPLSENALAVLTFIGKRVIEAPNEPGFITQRIIAMVINEAYFALEDGVSTAAEIDVAMKLGTNYPYGPFEWAEKIGHQHIYALLNELAKKDKRYKPCNALLKKVSGV